MPRPSKLTEKQWLEITERSMNGEKVRDLAKEFKVAIGTLSDQVTERRTKLKNVAEQIVTAERSVMKLNISEQIFARRLADEMREVSASLAAAGKSGANVARKMMAIAEAQAAKVDEQDPMESAETLQGVAALSRIANDSSVIALKLIATTKEAPDEKAKDEKLPGPDWDSMLKRRRADVA